MLGRLLVKLTGLFGYELRKRGQRASLISSVQNAKALGLTPVTVIDVGAAFGDFTSRCANLFPQARYLMVEPLEEYGESLEKICKKIPGARHFKQAAASKNGEMTINVHPDLVGSSLFLENEESDVNGVPRTVPTMTLDDLVRQEGASPNYLLKVDVQGGELDVLKGAAKLLEQTDFLIVEVSFFKFFHGGGLAFDVMSLLQGMGFVIYDIVGLAHRPLDGALAQVDMAFVKEDSPLRAHHHYATKEQRQALTRRLGR